MTTLYALTAEVLLIDELLEEQVRGELPPEELEAVNRQLVSLWQAKSLALAEKVDAVVGLVRNLEADAQAFKAERDLFVEKARLAEAKVERIKELVRWVAKETGAEKFQGGKFRISVGKAIQRPMVPDAKFLPEGMREEIVNYRTLWEAVRASVKAGVIPPGVEIVESTRPVRMG